MTALKSRRVFLQKGAALCAAAGVLPSQFGYAGPMPVDIRRVIFVFIPGGEPKALWSAQGCGMNYKMTMPSAPVFEPIKQHLVFLKDLTLGDSAGHNYTYQILGGRATQSQPRASLDVELINPLGKNVPFTHLTLSAGSEADPSITYSTYGEVAPLFDPFQAYTKLFDGLPSSELNPLDEDFRSPSDLVKTDFDKLSQLQIHLATLALKRNKTNIVSLMLGSDQMEFLIPGDPKNRTYHHMLHDDASTAEILRARTFLNNKFVYLVQLLAALKDSNSMPLLDSTLVVLTSNSGSREDYNRENAPFLLAGGRNFMPVRGLIEANQYTHLDLLDSVGALLNAPLANYGKGPIAKLLTS